MTEPTTAIDEMTDEQAARFHDWIGGGAGRCYFCDVHVDEGDDCPDEHYAQWDAANGGAA